MAPPTHITALTLLSFSSGFMFDKSTKAAELPGSHPRMLSLFVLPRALHRFSIKIISGLSCRRSSKPEQNNWHYFTRSCCLFFCLGITSLCRNQMISTKTKRRPDCSMRCTPIRTGLTVSVDEMDLSCSGSGIIWNAWYSLKECMSPAIFCAWDLDHVEKLLHLSCCRQSFNFSIQPLI